MESRTLGRTGLRVTALGMGTGSLWRPDREVALAAVARALDLGIGYFDTAPAYGQAESERRLGEGLRSHPAGAHATIATKLGFYPAGFDYSYDATLRSVHDSLERLGVSRLRLVQIHTMREEIWEPVMRPGGALAALRRLQAEGVVEHVGVTGGEEMPPLLRAVETGEFETLLIWRHYHLLDATAGEKLLPAAAARGIGVIVASFYAGAILATGPVPGARYLHQPATEEQLARAGRLAAVCARHGVSLPAAALQFALRGPGVATAVAGFQTPEEVDVGYAALQQPIPEALWSDLARIDQESPAEQERTADQGSTAE